MNDTHDGRAYDPEKLSLILTEHEYPMYKKVYGNSINYIKATTFADDLKPFNTKSAFEHIKSKKVSHGKLFKRRKR